MEPPQTILIALVFIELLLTALLHGAPRSEQWSFHRAFYNNVFLLGILYWGGFFR